MMRPKKQRRHVSACRRMERTAATEANNGWSIGDESLKASTEIEDESDA